MEINLNNKTVSVYKRLWSQSKTVQDSVESAISAEQPNIGRVVTVFSNALIKSKDVLSRTVSVSGEVHAVLMYLSEGGDELSTLEFNAPFAAEFDSGSDEQGFAIASLSVRRLEAHVLDERRVILSYEVQVDVQYYEQSEFCCESSVSESEDIVIHTLVQNAEAVNTAAVSERSFAVNEQYSFPQDMAAPKKIIWAKAWLEVEDSQVIASKAIVKGSANTELYYLPEDSSIPVKTVFSSPFSQIVELGTEGAEDALGTALVSSEYYNLVETVGGDLALDAEIHAVAQVRAEQRNEVSYIADAYSNSRALELRRGSRTLNEGEERGTLTLSATQPIEAGESMDEVIALYAQPPQLSARASDVGISQSVDILYRGADGALSSARRSISLEGSLPENAEIDGVNVSSLSVRQDKDGYVMEARADVGYVKSGEQSISEICGIECAEDAPRRQNSHSLYLVRQGSDSLWDIAKSYNSSLEEIEKANSGRDSAAGYIIVPRAL